MPKHRFRAFAFVLALLFTQSSCGKLTSLTSTDGGSTVSVKSLLGKVLVPQTTISSASLSAKGEVSETPLTNATVEAYDSITGEKITSIPAATTDSLGNYKLDTSKATTENLKNLTIKATKQEGSSVTVLQAFVSDATKGGVATVNAGSTVVANKVKEAIFDTAGDLIGKAATVPASEKKSLADKLPGFSLVAENLRNSVKADNLPTFKFTSTANFSVAVLAKMELQQLMQNKDVAQKILDASPAIKSEMESKKSEVAKIASDLMGKATFNKGLEMPNIPAEYATKYPFTIPAGMQLPQETVFNRGNVIPPEIKSIPAACVMASGFTLPTGHTVELGEGIKFKAGASIPDVYAAKLPPKMEIDKGVDLPKSAVLPEGAKFESGYELKKDKGFTYNANFTMPKNVGFESGYVMPSGAQVKYEKGFEMPANITMPSNMVIPKEVEKFAGEISTTMVGYLATDYKLAGDMKGKLANNVPIDSGLAAKLGDDFVIDSTLKSRITEIDGNVAGKLGFNIDASMKDKIKSIDGNVAGKLDFKIDSTMMSKVGQIDSTVLNKLDSGVKLTNDQKGLIKAGTEIGNDQKAFFDPNFKFGSELQFKNDFVFDQNAKFDPNFKLPTNYQGNPNQLQNYTPPTNGGQ